MEGHFCLLILNPQRTIHSCLLTLTMAWRESISVCIWCHCRLASFSSALAAFKISSSLFILAVVTFSSCREYLQCQVNIVRNNENLNFTCVSGAPTFWKKSSFICSLCNVAWPCNWRKANLQFQSKYCGCQNSNVNIFLNAKNDFSIITSKNG